MKVSTKIWPRRLIPAPLCERLRVLRTHDPESGALSLEWVAIAIVLVTAAIALATFLTAKLGALESLIPS
jgi:hypothetical protein